jgi:hypothetical protein
MLKKTLLVLCLASASLSAMAQNTAPATPAESHGLGRTVRAQLWKDGTELVDTFGSLQDRLGDRWPLATQSGGVVGEAICTHAGTATTPQSMIARETFIGRSLIVEPVGSFVGAANGAGGMDVLVSVADTVSHGTKDEGDAFCRSHVAVVSGLSVSHIKAHLVEGVETVVPLGDSHYSLRLTLRKG